jgi:SHOCT-like domain
MSENRRQILQMLSDSKISADEAERLIAALEKEPAAGPTPLKGEVLKPRAKYLRVLVEAQEHGHNGAPTKVNIRVPMQLLRAGVRLGALIPREARDRANEALREKGVQLDLNQIKPENLEELIEQLNDLEVNVDEDRAKVRVFCE